MAAEAQRYREFRMPDVGEGLTEAEILKWLVQPGDTVSDGQVVVEVETAKAAVELPIPYDGQVREVLFSEGSTVDVGTAIITVDTDPSAGPPPDGEAPAGEEQSANGGRQPVLVGYGVSAPATRRRPRKPRTPAAQTPEPRQEQAPVPPQAAAADRTHEPAHEPAAPNARPLAKPPVRKLAKDLGVDLTRVIPTGANGIITREDVHAAATAATAPPVPQPTAATAPAAPGPAPAVEPQSLAAIRERRVPVKGVRKATAQAMVASAFTAPHVTEFATVDVTRTMRLITELKNDPEFAGLRVNPLLLTAKALLTAIRRNPDVNSAWDEANQEIIHKNYVNLGIAAATPRGLVVPNIKDAHTKTLPQLAHALGDLVTTAREGKSTLADMRDGTVTITNIGVFGIDTGTPILTPGEAAILALGAIREQPWVHKGKIKPRHITTLALSFDHRLVDGELGSKVLADTAAVLEHPKRLITWG
ncbi:dihydrolipoamide acetyltransferase family protein [Streptomyces johnsoniae]|uniref:Dihydrolipoamide acetyltransferase component of pyruvate dehydrogenase complex n=1 Tax=Streptomyces johnsoniae TaxID=3075532 RepID=A0ABU2S8E5_9ACTN|nr:dihydrolipoamide acetyltransferase family protein [Streptomyces sp. DSM 41886]MDT0445253.1 dihydrolipoamide acetyltransferase family protein [Streptomyces sp. DSM 41886]